MSSVVCCAASNTSTLSSITGFKMERLNVKGLFSCQNETRYSLIYNEVNTVKLNLYIEMISFYTQGASTAQ